MNRPGMATGVNFFTGDLGGKRLALLCAMVPSAHVVGLLLNPRFGIEAADQHRKSIAAAAQTLGCELFVQEATTDAVTTPMARTKDATHVLATYDEAATITAPSDPFGRPRSAQPRHLRGYYPTIPCR